MYNPKIYKLHKHITLLIHSVIKLTSVIGAPNVKMTPFSHVKNKTEESV